MKRGKGLQGRPNPNATLISPKTLVRAAWLCGRGFPTEAAAARLQCCPRKLGTELNRLGMEKAPAHGPAGPDTLELRMKLSREERTALGSAALEACMYQPAVVAIIVRTVLGQGQTAIARLLREGGAR